MAKKIKETKADEKLLEEVKTRFQTCQDTEAENRNLWKDDLRFANGDPDNGWQWDESMRKQREIDKRPCLTTNKVKQHNRQITNDARQNKPSVRVYPVDSGADQKTAEIFNGIIRHIEANSDADVAYDTAAEFAVDAGLGYWRVTTDYASDESFDQEIFIRRIKNPLNVYLDPNIQEADGSDARFGFVFIDMPKDDFSYKYPDAEEVSWPQGSAGGDDWLQSDQIRICEYFRKVDKTDRLYADENGNTLLESELTPEGKKEIKELGLKSRVVKTCKIEWFLIAGCQEILERSEWLGKYIPIVRVIGDEMEIDGKVRRKGHTRWMKDAQRMYNYNSSGSVEFGALQTKTPFIAPADSIAGYEGYWDVANTTNNPYLPYNHMDENGTQIPPPQRAPAPTPAMLFIEGMRTASEEMKMTSGQYDESIGRAGNATSGRQELARQRKGDNATFHFVDNLSRAIKFTGKILIDLIPKVYDTPRVIRILGEDGSDSQVSIDPSMQKAYEKRKNMETQQVEEIYNPGVGRYDIVVAVGPSYSTKRAESFTTMMELAGRDPSLMQKAGDIIMREGDFPGSLELSERLKKFVPPEIIKDDDDDDIPPAAKAQIQQMTQQMQQLDGVVQAMTVELEDKAELRKIEEVKANTDAYKAITDRLKVLGPLLTTQEVSALAQETQREAMEQPDPGMVPSETMAMPEGSPMLPQEPIINPMQQNGMQQEIPPQMNEQGFPPNGEILQ